jgi:hypothetical protein
MTEYEALLRIMGEDSPPLPVLIDLSEDRVVIEAGGEQIADWDRHEVRVSALPDGFHVRAEGEEIILDVTEDAKFALDIGLRNAHPQLRKRMSALLRENPY